MHHPLNKFASNRVQLSAYFTRVYLSAMKVKVFTETLIPFPHNSSLFLIKAIKVRVVPIRARQIIKAVVRAEVRPPHHIRRQNRLILEPNSSQRSRSDWRELRQVCQVVDDHEAAATEAAPIAGKLTVGHGATVFLE